MDPGDAAVFEQTAVRELRRDLALALRAAAHHGLSEGVCNHFSALLPDGSDRYLVDEALLLQLTLKMGGKLG